MSTTRLPGVRRRAEGDTYAYLFDDYLDGSRPRSIKLRRAALTNP